MLKRRLIAALLALLLIISACSVQELKENAGAYMRFTDDTGTEVVLEQQPAHVAVLFSSFAEIWELAGGETAITVGESLERGFASEDAVLVDEGAGKTVNTELLIDAEPDFVICSADIEAQLQSAALLRDAGIPVAAFRVESFSDYMRVLKLCTVITDHEDAYETHGLIPAETIDDLFGSLEGAPTYEKILFIRAGSSSSSTKAKTADDHFAAAMLRELGTHNIAEDAPVLLDGLSIEAIVEADPDYIFVLTMGSEEAARSYLSAQIESNPAFAALSAVQNGRYVMLPKALFHYKPNESWDESYAFLARILYPEIFPTS